MLPLPLIALALAALGGRKRAGQPLAQRKPPTRARSGGTTTASSSRAAESPAQAARNLADYLRGGGAFGYKGNPSEEVARTQRALGLTGDGIVGPQTRNASRRLGVILPLRPSTRTPAPLTRTQGGTS